MNEGSVGCSFAVPSPIVDSQSAGSCEAFFIANNWSSPATLRVESEGATRPLDGAVWEPFVEGGAVKHRKLDGPIPPGGGAVVFVSSLPDGGGNVSWIGCPQGVKPIFEKDRAVSGSGMGRALFASADVPVSMYSIFPYGGARGWVPSGTILLPTTSWRKNYLVMSSRGGTGDAYGRGKFANALSYGLQAGRPTLQIVATEDDTSIDLLPRVDVIGGSGISPAARGEVANYRLRRGEILQLVQDSELVGSIVESSKPVAVFGGHTCMKVPSDLNACDGENKQISPLSAWGHEYVVLPTPHRNLTSSGAPKERDPSIVRLVGAANGTVLVYEPTRPDGAPDTLASGQLARFFADEPFVVRSQDVEHPFHAVAVMTSGLATTSGIGDPESAPVVPTDQWLDSYGFFADHSYQYSSVVVTRRKADGGFRDVTLDCAGALTGWKAIGGDYEWTSVALTRGGEPQSYPGGTCVDGAHRIESAGPFSLSVWGLDRAASYSYPGGMGLRPVTQLHVPVR